MWRLKSPNVVKKSVGLSLFPRQVSFIPKPSKQVSKRINKWVNLQNSQESNLYPQIWVWVMRPNRMIPSFLTLANQRELAFSHNHPWWLSSVTNNHPGAPGGFPAWPFHPLMHRITISHVACSELCVPALILDLSSICCVQLRHKHSVILRKWWHSALQL